MNEDSTEFLPCDPIGNPTPTISWFFDGDTRLDKTFDFFNFSIVEDGLLLQNITRDHRGEYKCRAHQMNKIVSHTAEKKFNVHVNCESRFN